MSSGVFFPPTPTIPTNKIVNGYVQTMGDNKLVGLNNPSLVGVNFRWLSEFVDNRLQHLCFFASDEQDQKIDEICTMFTRPPTGDISGWSLLKVSISVSYSGINYGGLAYQTVMMTESSMIVELIDTYGSGIIKLYTRINFNSILDDNGEPYNFITGEVLFVEVKTYEVSFEPVLTTTENTVGQEMTTSVEGVIQYVIF